MEALSTFEAKVICTDPSCVAEAIRLKQKLLLLDARSFMVYHTNHVINAINIGGNRACQRKLLRHKIPLDLLLCRLVNVPDVSYLCNVPIVIYDHCLDTLSNLRPDCFLHYILVQLCERFQTVFFIKGGFLSFQAKFPELCWLNSNLTMGEDVVEYHQSDCDLEKLIDSCLSTIGGGGGEIATTDCRFSSTDDTSCEAVPTTVITSPISSMTPAGIHCTNPITESLERLTDTKEFALTKSLTSCSSTTTSSNSTVFDVFLPSSARPSPILPHLVLGSEEDAKSASICKQYGITHIINVSTSNAIPSHIPNENFYQIPVNDNYTDRMTPYFKAAFNFIDSVKVSRGRVLVHCSAGISRSPTLAIAYLMYSCGMRMRDAYDVIKSGRSSVAPNFNFLGQLLEFEQLLLNETCSDEFPFIHRRDWLTSEEIKRSEFYGSSTSKLDTQQVHSSPKSASKKRDRPTYLGLDSFPKTPKTFNVQTKRINKPSSLFTDPGISPTEGKRSRVTSTFTPTRVVDATLLPSPCTGFSRLEISSPSEECRSIISSSRAPSLYQHQSRPLLTLGLADQKQHNIRSFLTTSTSLDALLFEPCSVVLSCSDKSNMATNYSSNTTHIMRLRRSSSTLASMKPTLLAHRTISSSHVSAPSTPRHLSVERSGAGVDKTGSTNVNDKTVVTVQELNISSQTSPEAKLEFDQLLQQSCMDYESPSLSSSSSVPNLTDNSIRPTPMTKPAESSPLATTADTVPRSFSDELLHTTTTTTSNNNNTQFSHDLSNISPNQSMNSGIGNNNNQKKPINNLRHVKQIGLSRSAPTKSYIEKLFTNDVNKLVDFITPINLIRHPSLSFGNKTTVGDSLVHDLRDETTSSSHNVFNRRWSQATRPDSSCRREQQGRQQQLLLIQQSCAHPANSSSGSGSLSSTTSHNSTHSGGCLGLFPVS